MRSPKQGFSKFGKLNGFFNERDCATQLTYSHNAHLHFRYTIESLETTISERAGYNPGMPGARRCKNPAVWRLPPRRPAERLSSHYGLDCEYGTSLMTCWQGGGSGPLYVCDDHAKNLEFERDLRGFGSSNNKK
jgi:hypothetical protein